MRRSRLSLGTLAFARKLLSLWGFPDSLNGIATFTTPERFPHSRLEQLMHLIKVLLSDSSRPQSAHVDRSLLFYPIRFYITHISEDVTVRKKLQAGFVRKAFLTGPIVTICTTIVVTILQNRDLRGSSSLGNTPIFLAVPETVYSIWMQLPLDLWVVRRSPRQGSSSRSQTRNGQ